MLSRPKRGKRFRAILVVLRPHLVTPALPFPVRRTSAKPAVHALVMAIEAFLGTTAQRAYLGTSACSPVLIVLPLTNQPNSRNSLVPALRHPSVTNSPLVRFRRSHRCPDPRGFGVQLGTIGLSFPPLPPPHLFPLIAGRCMGRLR